jgi:hypothetical protein
MVMIMVIKGKKNSLSSNMGRQNHFRLKREGGRMYYVNIIIDRRVQTRGICFLWIGSGSEPYMNLAGEIAF